MNKKAKAVRIFIGVVLLTLIWQLAPVPVYAEGANAVISLAVSRETLNRGKTFTVTVKIKPNTNIDITAFDAVLRFDAGLLLLVKADGRPAGVAEGFDLTVSNIPENELVILGEENKGGPIRASGETELLIITFKVRDDAPIGSDAVFSLLEDCAVNIPGLGGSAPEPIALDIAAPISRKIGAALDTNANLSSLSVRPGTLSPAFTAAGTAYKANVSAGTSSVEVTAAAQSPFATIAISGGKNLQYGTNTVTVTVKAQDPDIVKVYTLTVTRATPVPTATAAPSASESSPSEDVSASEPESDDPVSSQEESSFGGSSVPMSGLHSSEDSNEKSSQSSAADPLQQEIKRWKQISLGLFILFLLTFCVLLWFVIEKASNRGRIVKIKRR